MFDKEIFEKKNVYCEEFNIDEISI